MHSLRHAELKAARALEHLDAAKSELEKYFASEPYTISHYERPEIGRRILRITLNNPSDRTYLLIGDFAHNLRSSLDHVIWALASNAAQKAPDSKRIQWPALSTENDKDFKRQTEGVPAEAAAIIESLQSYHQPDGAYKKSVLWQLHLLDIIDKHRRVTFEQHSIDAHIPGATQQSDIRVETTNHGLEVSFPIGAPPFEMWFASRPEVRFGDADEGVSLDVPELTEMHRFVVDEVIPQFAKFFSLPVDT